MSGLMVFMYEKEGRQSRLPSFYFVSKLMAVSISAVSGAFTVIRSFVFGWMNDVSTA